MQFVQLYDQIKPIQMPSMTLLARAISYLCTQSNPLLGLSF